jgi:NAD(P)H-nitrite reductase large subunit
VLTNGRTIDCDVVVFTGSWIPDHELARRSGLAMDPDSKGPSVDHSFHTSRDNVFAIGNLVHKVAAADRCALDGTAVAAAVARSIA